MNMIKNTLGRLARDEEGQDLIEYALLAAFIALVCISAAQALGITLKGIFGDIDTQLHSTGAPPSGS